MQIYKPNNLSTFFQNIARKEMSTFNNGTFFSILDNSFSNWIYDLSTAAFTVLRPEIYFRSDVLCILFDYLLVSNV